LTHDGRAAQECVKPKSTCIASARRSGAPDRHEATAPGALARRMRSLSFSDDGSWFIAPDEHDGGLRVIDWASGNSSGLVRTDQRACLFRAWRSPGQLSRRPSSIRARSRARDRTDSKCDSGQPLPSLERVRLHARDYAETKRVQRDAIGTGTRVPSEGARTRAAASRSARDPEASASTPG
jgi:hypothetical protein